MSTRGFLSQPVTGVQRYAENITRGFFAIRDGIRLLASPEPLRALDGIDIPQIGTTRGHVWEQVENDPLASYRPRPVLGFGFSAGLLSAAAVRSEL